ncbi:ITGB1 (predicted) [Pycnogonum litorale]
MSFNRLLFAWTLILTFSSMISNGQEKLTLPCPYQETCGSCMGVQGCAWCTAEKQDFESAGRCDTFINLRRKGCPETHIYNQKNKMEIVVDRNLSDAGALKGSAIQVKPQTIQLTLRPNHTETVTLTFRQAEDYPLDLYYLMDLTANMRDHKDTLVKLGDRLSANMINITKNFRLGFGSFVDKVVMPYANMLPAKLKNPCTEEFTCRTPYGYQNHLPLDKNVTKFVEQVQDARFSGNLDDAEGGLDAIMQAIVCENQIRWNKNSRKIIVFATGSIFHIAGDGKLGGIVQPNDGKCHMDGKGYYTESTSQDYPTLGQISTTIAENKVIIIFAVPNKHIGVYERMSKVIGGSTVAKMAEDSSNIVQLIRDQYNKISSEVRLVDDAPPGIKIRYFSKCLGKTLEETNTCVGLKVGATTEFLVELELNACPFDKSGWSKDITIHPYGLQDKLVIDLQMLCQCECESTEKQIKNSSDCSSGRGTRQCGICKCNENYYGTDCECKGGEAARVIHLEKCKMTNTSDVCSGRGVCRCGNCDCFRRQKADEFVYGDYCECDNFSCDRGRKGEVCGGPRRGLCGCNGLCDCLPGWTGKVCDCGSTATCMNPEDPQQVVCSGRGDCDCGLCRCSQQDGVRYWGQYCEDCKDCKHKCDELSDCIKCLVFDEGPLSSQECSEKCDFVPTLHSEVTEEETETETRCQIEAEEDCFFVFVYSYNSKTHNIQVRAQKDKTCRKKINLVWLIAGLTGGVFLIGVIIVLIIRLFMYLKDKREYEAHLKQVADTDWNKATTNPLHVPPSTDYKNPTYGLKE